MQGSAREGDQEGTRGWPGAPRRPAERRGQPGHAITHPLTSDLLHAVHRSLSQRFQSQPQHCRFEPVGIDGLKLLLRETKMLLPLFRNWRRRKLSEESEGEEWQLGEFPMPKNT